jgi:hypothetical protein
MESVNFTQALEMLEMGIAMHRKSWTAEDGYLTLMHGMKFVWKIVLIPAPNAGNYIFCVEDFLATDWQKFEAAKPVIESPVIPAG